MAPQYAIYIIHQFSPYSYSVPPTSSESFVDHRAFSLRHSYSRAFSASIHLYDYYCIVTTRKVSDEETEENEAQRIIRRTHPHRVNCFRVDYLLHDNHLTIYLVCVDSDVTQSIIWLLNKNFIRTEHRQQMNGVSECTIE
jgi:hypothetical protein